MKTAGMPVEPIGSPVSELRTVTTGLAAAPALDIFAIVFRLRFAALTIDLACLRRGDGLARLPWMD